MRLLTKRDLIRGVADEWRKNYQYPNGVWSAMYHCDTYKRLLALNLDTATAEDVHRCGCNETWTGWRCYECKKHVTAVVEVGGANLCQDCCYAVGLLGGNFGGVKT